MKQIIAKIKKAISNFQKANPKLKGKELVLGITAVVSLVTYNYYNSKKSEPSILSKEKVSMPSTVKSPVNNNEIVASENSYKNCKANELPSFVNVSLTWGGTTFGRALKSLSPPSIMVVAAGNKHPDPIRPEKVQASRDFDAIVVGSMDPDGKRSDFSHTHEEVHIMAPAGSYQSSADEEGNRQNFGGTSGATPLVTGGLAGFEWLAGYHPTAEEAKILLEKTAISTLDANKTPRLSGVGMLNAYKLGMVGKRLKQTCGSNISCFKEMIQKEETYVFPTDKGLIRAVNQAFPQCSRNQCGVGSNQACENKALVFKRLRKAAFLDPSNGELWRSIACIYDSNNLVKNAQGAMSFYKATFGNIDHSLYTSCKVDADCGHVPSCSSSNLGMLLPANKGYVAECQGRVLCNNKCRCGNQELGFPTNSQNVFGARQAYCVKSRCVSRYSTYISRSQEQRQPASADERSGGGSGTVR